MEKKNVCILFGGMSPEHEVSLRSAEAVLNNIDREKYRVFPVGISREGSWILFGGDDTAMLPADSWQEHPANLPAAISPVWGQGLLIFEGSGVRAQKLDVVFPVLHGRSGEDGAMQGLMQLAGIPCVGPGVAASAVAMDKTLTKLAADHAGVRQADWLLVPASELGGAMESICGQVEARFDYPVFVKPAGTGSSVGVSKAHDRAELAAALALAGKYDEKILVEEFIRGREVEIAVLGNEEPIASLCGEIDSGADFYDYDAKYITDSSVAYIPARISPQAAQTVKENAIKVYKAVGCRGLSRVDFFVSWEGDEVIFNEINTLPGFTSISMYPKLFTASGLSYPELIDRLLSLAMEAQV